MCLPWSGGSFVHSSAHPWLVVVWTILWSSILYGLLPSRVGLCLIVGFSLFSPLFAPSINLQAFLPRHFVILAVVLFDLYLLGLFWACCMLFFHLITVTHHCHWHRPLLRSLNTSCMGGRSLSCTRCPLLEQIMLLGPLTSSRLPYRLVMRRFLSRRLLVWSSCFQNLSPAHQ